MCRVDFGNTTKCKNETPDFRWKILRFITILRIFYVLIFNQSVDGRTDNRETRGFLVFYGPLKSAYCIDFIYKGP